MKNDNSAKGKTRQITRKITEETAKLANDKSQLGVPKICPSCHNPYWEKTARNM
jgi:hypothetical protein